jgi:hypothetical protein
MKPRIFIGSSTESLKIAYAIQESLEHVANVTVWTQGIFELSAYSLESLLSVLEKSDFSIFVFSPEDLVTIRDKTFLTVRDNVIFELGLFTGRHGKDRNFIIMPRGVQDFHLPTDLLGITPATYDPGRPEEELIAALGPACNKITRAIQKLSPTNSAVENLNFFVSKYRDAGANYPLKIRMEIRNFTGRSVVLTSRYFRFKSLRPDKEARGDIPSGRFEVKFPDATKARLDEVEYLLRNRETVRTWIPIDPGHTDEEVDAAISGNSVGEFLFTCTWLGEEVSTQEVSRKI